MESSSFLEHLKSSGILSDDQIAEVSGRFSNSAMQVVVSDLVSQGLLTPFQVKQLHAGQPKGLVLGQYHLLDELGRGGYGCVYRARHKLMNRIVALKVIAPERVEDSRARAWFRREVLAATQLDHPNIALAYDADEIDGILFFAMEYIDGLNLDMLVRSRGPLPIGTACEMLLQTAKALQYAHEKGMVHRDIKPANLLIPRSAIADAASDFAPQPAAGSARPVLIKVVDFGLARLHSSSSSNTLVLQNERGFVGTPAYVSPEQAHNVHEVDIRSDLYSLGCTFYHALAGRPPFLADTPLQIVVQHLEKEPEPIERLRPEIPSALASILRRLMAKKPDKRFQTPAELLGELGFFYTLDRSGVQRAIPFALSEPVRSSQPTPSVISPTRLPEYPIDLAEESAELPPTRFVAWEDQTGPQRPRSPGEFASSVPVALPESSADLPQTLVTPRNGAAADPNISQESSAPASLANDDRETRAVDRNLIRSWQQWASVIDDLTAGRSPAVDDVAYRALHRRLLESCDAQGDRADRRQSRLFQQIAELVKPWLSLATLNGIDRETLVSLHNKCHAMTARLGAGSYGLWTWVLGVLILLLVSSASYYFIQTVGPVQIAPISAWPGLIQRNPLVSLAFFLPAVLITSAIILNKLLNAPRRE